MQFFKLLAILLLVASCAKARIIQNFSMRQSKVVIAHRGASGELPEHTKEAFVLAHSMEADFIEADVVSSKDGILFALHDLTLDGTTDVAVKFPKRARKDGHYYAIDFLARELKTLNVHERVHPETGSPVFPNRFDPNSKARFEMPTIKELIDLVIGMNHSRQKNTGIYLEPKRSEFHRENRIDLISKLSEVISSAQRSEPSLKVIVESFNPTDLKSLKFDYHVNNPLVQLIGENSWAEANVDFSEMLSAEGMKEVAEYADGIGPWVYQLIRPSTGSGQVVVTNLVNFARNNSLFIHAYTVRSDSLPTFAKGWDELLEMLYLGVKVDGVFTDQPAMAVGFLNRYSAKSSTIQGK